MTTITKLIEAEDIRNRVRDMARQIAARMPVNDPVLICVLKGAFVLTADLLRELGELGLSPRVEFLRLSSYGDAKESSGEILVLGDVPKDTKGRHLLVVDDILDTGRSLDFAKSMFLRDGAASVATCTLLDKPQRRVVNMQADYVGFEIDDLFVVGYGIDYAEQYRHLPFVGTVD